MKIILALADEKNITFDVERHKVSTFMTTILSKGLYVDMEQDFAFGIPVEKIKHLVAYEEKVNEDMEEVSNVSSEVISQEKTEI
tara:strand:- start:163 stop:414 length:252 start_codon:yes stop_codon:yes gene_type:complete